MTIMTRIASTIPTIAPAPKPEELRAPISGFPT